MADSRKLTLGRKDIESILRRGSRTEKEALRLYWRASSDNSPSVFSLSIKSGVLKRAVDRNRWKRVVREAVRASGYQQTRGLVSVFVLIRVPTIELSLAAWKPIVQTLLHAAGAC